MASGRLEFRPGVDRTSRIKNPGRGWCLYVDAFRAVLPQGRGDDSGVPPYSAYWDQMDGSGASSWADILYVRVPWSELEPCRGHYAWEENRNIRGLIDGATQRKLRLALRVYVDSRDGYRQATPDYVRQQGGKGRLDPESGLWSPFLDDPIFQQAFEQFLAALAVRFDDADQVDFIDGQGLGWWGEMHHLLLDVDDDRTLAEVYRWVTLAYLHRFQHVLVGVQYGGGNPALSDWALAQGAVVRRDSLGSPLWFTVEDRAAILQHWPQVPVFAENCYHHLVTRENWWRGDGFSSVRAVLERVYEHARDVHANTLDLRVAEDAKVWMHAGRDLVEAFALHAGYRLALTQVMVAGTLRGAHTARISHMWANFGFGKFPGDRHGWRGRYYPAFCFWSETAAEPEAMTRLPDIDPSAWIAESEYRYASDIAVPPKAGTYRLMATLWDGTKNAPASIRLAHASPEQGWYRLGTVVVENGQLRYGLGPRHRDG